MSRTKNTNRSANGSGSIRKITTNRKGKQYVYWQARYTVGYDPGTGKQIQKSITGKTQKEVSQKLKQLTYEIDRGIYVAPTKLTTKEWLEIWQKDYLGGVKESTAYLYRRTIEQYVVPNLGATKLESLNATMVQEFYNGLLHPEDNETKPLSPKSIKNVHGIFHKALQQAVLTGHLRYNPTNACTLPRIVKKEIQPLDQNQVVDFLNAIRGHIHEYLYKVTLFTGIREGEVLGLAWDCIDFERSTLTIKRQLRKEQKKGGKYYFSPPKNNKTRIISLPPSILGLFQLQMKKQKKMREEAGSEWKENNLVFTNQTGGFLSHRTVYDCFKRIVAEMGIPATRFHDLRHTYAVVSIMNGDDIKTVQENLGHATAAFTLDIYGHVTNQMKQNSAGRMEQFIQSISSPKQ